MPPRKTERKMCRKRNTYISKTYPYRRKNCRDFKNDIVNRRLKDLNDIIYNYKSKESWKVVPKDSLEVHKDRRKRQIDDERKKEENKNDENDQDKREDDSNGRNISRKITRRRRRYNSRRRRDSELSESSSSCSSLSCCTSCANHMDYE